MISHISNGPNNMQFIFHQKRIDSYKMNEL
jgi:hypothetical protein